MSDQIAHTQYLIRSTLPQTEPLGAGCLVAVIVDGLKGCDSVLIYPKLTPNRPKSSPINEGEKIEKSFLTIAESPS